MSRIGTYEKYTTKLDKLLMRGTFVKVLSNIHYVGNTRKHKYDIKSANGKMGKVSSITEFKY